MKSFKEHLEESLRKPQIVDFMRRAKLDPDHDGGPDFIDSDGEIFFLTDYLRKSGWKYISGGAYSSVYTNPAKPYIIKVFSQRDTGYKTWITFCLANQSNPFIPKIYGRPTPINNEIAFVRLENLTSDDRALAYYYQCVAWSKTVGTDGERDFPLPGHNIRKQWMKVHAYLRNIGHSDIHHGNVMLRGRTAQPVIIDPMADYSYELKPTKFSSRSQQIFKSRFELRGEDE